MEKSKIQEISTEELQKLYREASKVIVVSGAGISSGLLSTYRKSPSEQNIIKSIMTEGAFSYKNISRSLPFYGNMGIIVSKREAPSFHHWMGKQKKVISHYTQNIDSIEERVPGLDSKTIYLHGNINKVKCTKCGARQQVENFGLFEKWRMGETDKCKICPSKRSRRIQNGVLVPDVVLYYGVKSDHDILKLLDKINSDKIDLNAIELNDTAIQEKPNLILVVGTSLASEVQDTISVLKDFKSKNNKIVFVNPKAPSASRKKLLDYWFPATSTVLAYSLGFKAKQKVKFNTETVNNHSKRKSKVQYTIIRLPAKPEVVLYPETIAKRAKNVQRTLQVRAKKKLAKQTGLERLTAHKLNKQNI